MKTLNLPVSDKKILQIAFLNNLLGPHELLMQATGTTFTILVGDHPSITHIEFDENLAASLRR